jgi:hypothetical protein
MLNRAKIQVAANRRTVLLLTLAAGVLAFAGAAYIYTHPPTVDQDPEVIERFNVSSELDHSATVTRESPLYPTGERLESQAAYFVNATPRLTLSGSVQTPGDRRSNITQRIILRERATRADSVFWNRERVLAMNQTIVNGKELEINASINVSALQQEQSRITSTIQAAGRPTTTILFEVQYRIPDSTGNMRSGTIAVQPTLRIVDNAFWLDGSLDARASETRATDPGVIEQDPQMGYVFGLSMLGVLLILGGSVVSTLSRRVDTEELQKQVQHEQYSEWISEGEIIVDPNSRYVYLDSIKDVINVGIDADKRIIYDPSLDVYTVADGDRVYYYTENPSDIEQWMDI